MFGKTYIQSVGEISTPKTLAQKPTQYYWSRITKSSQEDKLVLHSHITYRFSSVCLDCPYPWIVAVRTELAVTAGWTLE